MIHITSDEWKEQIGETQISVSRDYDIYRKESVFELIIRDEVDWHSRFYLYGDLNTIKQIGLTIEKLVSAANSK